MVLQLPDVSFIVPLLVTLTVGVLCGLLFRVLKIPGGALIGSFAGTAVLTLATGITWLPVETRTVVQIVAGAFIGCLFGRSDLMRIKRLAKPVLLMLTTFLLLSLILGFLIWLSSPLDLVTALMSAVPGGINDIPIIAADMGGDAPVVTVLQLVRLILGVGIFPVMISLFDRYRVSRGYRDCSSSQQSSLQSNRKAPQQKMAWKALVLTLVIAAAAGMVGKAFGVPGLTFTAAITATLILKLTLNFAYIPRWMKVICQLLSGTYLGTLLTMESLMSATSLMLPAGILIVGYIFNCFASGWLETKLFGYTRKEGMLIVSPAGGSEMALVMEDLQVSNTDILVMQTARILFVVAVFPQIINLICHAVLI